MSLYTASEVGNLHLRVADYREAHFEAHLMPESGRVFLGIALRIPHPNVATLALTPEQAAELAEALLGALPPVLP